MATFLVLLALPFVDLVPQSEASVMSAPTSILNRPVFSPSATLITTPQWTSNDSGIYGRRWSVADALQEIYLGGLLLLLLRLVIGFNYARRILLNSSPAAGDYPYRVRLSSEISVPLATWWMKPLIVLPSTAVAWSSGRWNASVEHEAAHIRRGDLVYFVLSKVIRIVYWPNPLIWKLCRELSDSAEAATDDCVIGAGIDSHEYAGILVETASEARRLPTAAIAMAKSSRIKSRVTAVLDQSRNRGSAHPLQQAGIFALIGSVAIALARFGAGSLSLCEYSTTDSMGREIRLIRLQRWTPNGIEAWKPDGTPIRPLQVIRDDWRRHDPAELHLYFEIDDDGVESSSAGIGSGNNLPGDPPLEDFMGGFAALKGPGPDKRMIVSFLRVPRLGPSGMTAVSFGYNATEGKPLCTIYPTEPSKNQQNIPAEFTSQFPSDFADRTRITYPAYSTPVLRNNHGVPVSDGRGGFKRSQVQSTELTYTELTKYVPHHKIEPIAYSPTGAIVRADGTGLHRNGPLYDFSYLWPVKPEEIHHISLFFHHAFVVQFKNIHLRPDRGPRP